MKPQVPESPSDREPQRGPVPLGQAVDDRPAPRRSRAATNDAGDRKRALLLIGSLLMGVLLVVILGNTVLKPLIVDRRERTMIRITGDQVRALAEIAADRYLATGFVPAGFSDLRGDDRLETSDGSDLWGTPFTISRGGGSGSGEFRIVVRSAGPDREFQTEDDLVAERVLDSADPAGTRD